MKFAITLLIVGIIAVAGAWYFVVVMDTPAVPGTIDTDPTSTAPTSTDDGTDDDTASWQSFQSEVQAGYRLTLSYPSGAEVTQVRDTIYELKFIGPAAERNTEITDGYYITLVFTGDTTLGTYRGRDDAAGEITDVTFSGYTGVTYDTISELSGQPVQHWVVAPDGEAAPVLDVTAQTYGDTDGSYQATVDAILESITLEKATGDMNGNDLIRIDEPQPGETVGSPISVSGQARGTWLFEATAPVSVVNWDGLILGEGFIEAEGDWMTEDFVPFSGTIRYEQEPQPYSASGTVIFQKANPSGLPEHDAAVEVPVLLE